MINIVDAVCGVGKTTGMFGMMRSNTHRSYLYISLFLDEVGDGNKGVPGRIQKELPELDFKMPKNLGEGKLDNLKGLIESGVNIASTHSLFSMFDMEVVELLVNNGYVLIIDEAVDCIHVHEDTNKSDVQALIAGEFIHVDVDGCLSWNETKYPSHSGKYSDIRDSCALGNLYIYNNVILIWEYPPTLLRLLDDIFIATYMFEGSIMSSWLKVNDIEYSYVDNAVFGLLDQEVVKQRVRGCLELLDARIIDKLNINDNSFSSTWYKNARNDTIAEVKRAMVACVNTHKAKCGDVFWTTFVAHRGRLQGKGYTSGNPEPFLPYNTKATNNYRDRWLCMYTVNIFKNPIETGYLRSKGVEFNQELYALSEMIQFIFRGSCRAGKPMKLLILSPRMKRLLQEWLYNE